MSRAKEIKEKQELQAKLALAFSTKTATVLSWLDTDSNTDQSTTQDELTMARKDFFSLPVVATGAGLSFGEGSSYGGDETDKHDISTVGEFVKSNKKVSSLAKKKLQSNTRNSLNSNVYRISKDDSKATIALKNKMRDSKRNEVKKDFDNKQFTKKFNNDRYEKSMKQRHGTTDNSIEQKKNHKDIDDDDDSDDEGAVQKTSKKNSFLPLQFGKKKK